MVRAVEHRLDLTINPNVSHIRPVEEPLESAGRKGQCWDNAVAESFFATIKAELIDRRSWPTRKAVHKAIFEYIEGWYNTRRLHSSLGYLSPNTYETTHHTATSHRVA